MKNDDRFWLKVSAPETPDACWLWTGALDRDGYGMVSRQVDGVNKQLRCSRYVLMLKGVDLDNLEVDHRCHVRACVRPDHLRLVTHKQNGENRSGAYVTSKSGVRGVHWEERTQRWVAEVGGHTSPRQRRKFKDFGEACAAVLEMRKRAFTHSD